MEANWRRYQCGIAIDRRNIAKTCQLDGSWEVTFYGATSCDIRIQWAATETLDKHLQFDKCRGMQLVDDRAAANNQDSDFLRSDRWTQKPTCT